MATEATTRVQGKPGQKLLEVIPGDVIKTDLCTILDVVLATPLTSKVKI